MNVYLESCCEAVPSAGDCPNRGRILFADDDEILRELVSVALTHHGFTVDAVEDGRAAWQALQINQYDALVTDQNMPALRGMDLVKKMSSAGMTLPVIMASGNLEELAPDPWLQSVATLEKPYSSVQLLDKVNHVLHGRISAPSAGLDSVQEWREAV